ncbi:MAG TPA: DUF2203 domain-containing protein [Ktedonobacteraceae bacterium]|jgi:hypothetical protein
MTHYFTREEAEALLPEISIVLRTIQECHLKVRSLEEDLVALRAQAMGNGHHLHDRMSKVQKSLFFETTILRDALHELEAFGCELKDPTIGLIDFLFLHSGKEAYLCWHLGEEHIAFWHPLDVGYMGRQPL